MDFTKLVEQSRTCRRYHREKHLSLEQLRALVDLARMSPNARNGQILRYCLIHSPALVDKANSTFTLGGALSPEQRPGPDQLPSAAIAMLAPIEANVFGIMDVGIAAQSMMLGATQVGLGACMVGAFNKPALHEIVCPPEAMEVKLLLVLGYPAEKRSFVPWTAEESRPYFRDEQNHHVVTRRPLEDFILSTL